MFFSYRSPFALLATSCKGGSHRPTCIYNKGNLLGKSMEGGATKLVPGLARNHRSEDKK